jgi:hypothetical protein
LTNAATDLMRAAKKNRAASPAVEPRIPGESAFDYVRRTSASSRQLVGQSYLQLNPITEIWRVRIKVPRHLTPFMRGAEAGLKHLTKSTGSGNEAEAKKIAAPIIEYYLILLDRAERLFRGDLTLEDARRKDILDEVRSSLYIAGADPTNITERDIAEMAEFFDRSDQQHAFRLIPKRRRRTQPVRE